MEQLGWASCNWPGSKPDLSARGWLLLKTRSDTASVVQSQALYSGWRTVIHDLEHPRAGQFREDRWDLGTRPTPTSAKGTGFECQPGAVQSHHSGDIAAPWISGDNDIRGQCVVDSLSLSKRLLSPQCGLSADRHRPDHRRAPEPRCSRPNPYAQRILRCCNSNTHMSGSTFSTKAGHMTVSPN